MRLSSTAIAGGTSAPGGVRNIYIYLHNINAKYILYMYVRMYVCMYVIYIYVYAYVYVYICIYYIIYICVCDCVRVSMCVQVNI